MDNREGYRTVQGRKVQRPVKDSPLRERPEDGYYKPRPQNINGIRRHHQNKQKARRLFMARVRAVCILFLTIVVIASVLLLTPLCDIRSVSVEGNSYVSTEEIIQAAGDLSQTNVITVSRKKIQNKIKSNKYIKDARVTKKIIPPSLIVSVSEYIPAGYIQSGSKYLTIDKDLYVIDDAADINGLPCITGLKISDAAPGVNLEITEENQADAVRTFLEVMSEDETGSRVINADFSDYADISFNYDNRLEVSCGSYIDLDKKLRLFRETVKSDDISDTARGTIDLSTVGTARYLP